MEKDQGIAKSTKKFQVEFVKNISCWINSSTHQNLFQFSDFRIVHMIISEFLMNFVESLLIELFECPLMLIHNFQVVFQVGYTGY